MSQKTMPIILRWLPPDANIPSDLPSRLRAPEIMLNAFAVERGDERFMAGFACGKLAGGSVKISTTGQAVLDRMAAVNKNQTIVVVELRSQKNAWRKVRAHLFDEPHNGHIVLFLAADDRIYDAASCPKFYDAAIAIFDHEGALLPKLSQ